jgi:transcriptional regulator with XRE-family HTH domain
MPGGRPAKTTRTPLGERIAAARIAAGLSQTQLAEKLGVSQRVVTYWEREADGLKADQLAKLTDALAVTGDFLLGREAPAPKRTGGPVGKAKQVFEAVSKLPRDQQRDILRTVEDLIAARALRKTA